MLLSCTCRNVESSNPVMCRSAYLSPFLLPGLLHALCQCIYSGSYHTARVALLVGVLSARRSSAGPACSSPAAFVGLCIGRWTFLWTVTVRTYRKTQPGG